MRFEHMALFASSAAAISMPDLSSVLPLFARAQGGNPACPAIWNTISSDLTKMFLDTSTGQCNADARAAIRLIFHDCGTWDTTQGATGGCDGSVVIFDDENSRGENRGLQDISGKIKALASQRGVTVADLVVFAGNHAIVTCPGGPRVKTFIGRQNAKTVNPGNGLPDVTATGDVLFKLFQAKGFSAVDLAALLGAHSTSTQAFVDPSKANAAQDSSPGVWDVKYYAETTNPPPGVFVFQSDSALAAHATVGKEFSGFVNNQGKWNGKFADAMGRMALFGSGGSTGAGMADCTNALPASTNVKRELRGMPLFAPRN